MTVTLNLPPQVEQADLAEAQARGLPLDEIVREALITPARPRLRSRHEPEEWVRRFAAWTSNQGRNLPVLPDEAMSRESIYADRGLVAAVVDTNLLLRSLNSDDPHYGAAASALAKLRLRTELCIAPQNLIEFWAVATRPRKLNGLGMTTAEAETEITGIRHYFGCRPIRPLYWKRGKASSHATVSRASKPTMRIWSP